MVNIDYQPTNREFGSRIPKKMGHKLYCTLAVLIFIHKQRKALLHSLKLPLVILWQLKDAL